MYVLQRQNDIGDYESSQLLTNWLMKSDIKNIDGSEDIIKAICDEEVINFLIIVFSSSNKNILFK